MSTRPRVLVAPLDWGLGHATRCVPVIRALLARGAAVSIASNGNAMDLLKIEFPNLPTYELPSYNIKYSRGTGFMWHLFLQAPRLLAIIRREHKVLERLVDRGGFDVVIADNRFGCWTRKAKTVFITHQLHILMPPAFKWIEPIVNFFNRRFIKSFDVCWIPDLEGSPLSGKLSLTKIRSMRNIGWLSRFSKSTVQHPKKYYCVGIVSGPEPQRTLFEQRLREQLQLLNEPCALVKGIPTGARAWSDNGRVAEIDHLPSDEMLRMIEQSEWIIARSGYSTIMDLATVGAQAIFVPTPGQTEQEYLASKLKAEGIALFQSQSEFEIKSALAMAKKYRGFATNAQPPNLLTHAIAELLYELD